MKVRMLVMVITMVLVAYGSAGAWGLPALDIVKKVAGTVTGGGAATNPDTFLAKAKASEVLVNRSAEQLFSLIVSKEEQAKAEVLQQKINATSDASEKKALLQEKSSSILAAVSKSSADAKLAEEAKSWDAKKKTAAVNSLFNLALAGRMAADLVPEGQNMVKSIQGNPLLLAKAGTLLEAVKTLGGIGSGTAKVVSSLPPVFSAAKIDVKLPTSSTETAKDVEI